MSVQEPDSYPTRLGGIGWGGKGRSLSLLSASAARPTLWGMEPYDFTDKTPEELLRDFQNSTALAKRDGGDAFELGNLAIMVHTARQQVLWTKVAACSAAVAARAAIAAVIVAVAG